MLILIGYWPWIETDQAVRLNIELFINIAVEIKIESEGEGAYIFLETIIQSGDNGSRLLNIDPVILWSPGTVAVDPVVTVGIGLTADSTENCNGIG